VPQRQQRGRSGRGQDPPPPPASGRFAHRNTTAAPEPNYSRATAAKGRSSRRGAAILGLVEAAEGAGRSDDGNASVRCSLLGPSLLFRNTVFPFASSLRRKRKSKWSLRAEAHADVRHLPLPPRPLPLLLLLRFEPHPLAPQESRHALHPHRFPNPPLPPKKSWKTREQRDPGVDRQQAAVIHPQLTSVLHNKTNGTSHSTVPPALPEAVRCPTGDSDASACRE
jgi:hypothetical protein